MGSWAVHAEWVSVRVSTWGRGGGALLLCVAWACPRRTGYQKTTVLGRRGPAFSRGATFPNN